jgi:hypothetical protein
MKPFSLVAKSIHGNDVVVTMSGSKKQTVAHKEVVLVWGTNIDKEIIKTDRDWETVSY